MYESAQSIVGYLLAITAITAAGSFLVNVLIRDPHYPEHSTNGNTTRIGNHKDRSHIAIETRARLATGWTGDGSADYCGSRPCASAPVTKPATAEKIGPAF